MHSTSRSRVPGAHQGCEGCRSALPTLDSSGLEPDEGGPTCDGVLDRHPPVSIRPPPQHGKQKLLKDRADRVCLLTNC